MCGLSLGGHTPYPPVQTKPGLYLGCPTPEKSPDRQGVMYVYFRVSTTMNEVLEWVKPGLGYGVPLWVKAGGIEGGSRPGPEIEDGPPEMAQAELRNQNRELLGRLPARGRPAGAPGFVSFRVFSA